MQYQKAKIESSSIMSQARMEDVKKITLRKVIMKKGSSIFSPDEAIKVADPKN